MVGKNWARGLRTGGVLCALSALGATGCRNNAVKAMFANEFNCTEENVEIDEIGPERLRASGCDKSVVYQCFDRTCIPMREEQSASAAPAQKLTPVASSAGENQVGRAYVHQDAKGRNAVELNLRLDERTLLRLGAVPAKKPEIELKLVRKHGEEQDLKECPITALVNGERMDFPTATYKKEELFDMLSSTLGGEMVRELATLEKFAIGACSMRWPLAPEGVAELRHFADLYQEEAAWNRPAHAGSTGGLSAPPDGWPAWKAVPTMPAAVSSPVLEGPALFKLLSPSVFKVVVSTTTGTQQGSAVAVSTSELLTNCHVVQSGQKIVLRQGKQERSAKLVRSAPAADRCVLSVSEANLTPLRGVRTRADLQVGEPLYTLGSPSGLELSLASGLLSGLREEEGQTYVQTTAPISPGSSGGGLFDARGNLVGITTGVLAGRERLNQSLNFAIPAELFFQ